MPNIPYLELLALVATLVAIVLFLFCNRKAIAGPPKIAPCTRKRLDEIQGKALVSS